MWCGAGGQIEGTGSSADIKPYSGAESLQNKTISINAPYSNASLVGFKLYAGYGEGSTANLAFDDLLKNSRFNVDAYVIPADPSSAPSITNYTLGGQTSGNLTNYSATATYKVADAHVGKTGYVLTFASSCR